MSPSSRRTRQGQIAATPGTTISSGSFRTGASPALQSTFCTNQLPRCGGSEYGFLWRRVNSFINGKGQITITESGKAGKPLLQVTIPLTPGPLVVAVRLLKSPFTSLCALCAHACVLILTGSLTLVAARTCPQLKDSWPPKAAKDIETIAASYVSPTKGSKVRLFNLAVDVPTAGLRGSANGGKVLDDKVKFSLGSDWAPIANGQQTFTAFVDGGGDLAKATFTPPLAPQVFTTFLLGSKGYGYTLVPQVDAPEYGVCKPSADLE